MIVFFADSNDFYAPIVAYIKNFYYLCRAKGMQSVFPCKMSEFLSELEVNPR